MLPMVVSSRSMFSVGESSTRLMPRRWKVVSSSLSELLSQPASSRGQTHASAALKRVADGKLKAFEFIAIVQLRAFAIGERHRITETKQAERREPFDADAN